jgi:hypothetical protein
MSLFDTYIGRVGRQLGTNRLFVAATGFFNVGDVSGGADGVDITGAQLKGMLMQTRTSFTLASAIQTVSVIPAAAGVVNFYYPSATTSVRMPIATVGNILLLRFDGVLSTISILAGSNALGSAQSILLGVSDLSCVLISNITATVSTQANFVEFYCETAGAWQVAMSAGTAGGVALQRS